MNPYLDSTLLFHFEREIESDKESERDRKKEKERKKREKII